MSGLSEDDFKKLKALTEILAVKPELLHKEPKFDCLKKLIEHFGGRIPTARNETPEFKPTAASASKVDLDSDMEEDLTDESELSDIPGLDEGVIKPDDIGVQSMGDINKTPTEEEIDESTDVRSKAAAAYGEQNYQEAITLYTKAIELNPGNALFHAKRGQAYLKLLKPNACIRDCDKALEINCDSAAAYKFRGRAHRLLGNWEMAAKDLRQACKLDFDEEGDEWLREVTPIAKKIEQHRINKERNLAERKRKQQQRGARAARKAHEEAAKNPQQEQETAGDGAGAGFGAGGLPPGFPNFNAAGAGGAPLNNVLNLLMAGVQDPEVAAAFADIENNSANIGKYASNPKISKLINLLKDTLPGGQFPGFGGAGAGAAAGADIDTAAADVPPAQAQTKPQPNKPDFADDGLD